MSESVYLLWFVVERPEPDEDTELLIGVYSSEFEARAAIERLKDKPGFVEFPAGFQICPYELNQDNWTGGYARV